MSTDPPILTQLMQVIQDRKQNPSSKSYTTTLLAGGVAKIGEKVVEEAAEVVEAAESATDEKGRAHLAAEAADLIYHLLVMLGHRDVEFAQVESVLAGRFGISGLEEKASRDQVRKTSNQGTGDGIDNA